MLDRRDHSSGRTEGIRGYSEDRNSVDDVSFELLKGMPENQIPLRQWLKPEQLHRLIEQYPRASLKQLCEQVRLELGVSLSITSMSRLLREQDLSYEARQQLAINAKLSPLSKAT